MVSDRKYIPYREIPAQLNIRSGDTLVIASDITRLAMVSMKKEGSFDANDFIDAFQAKLGKNGTLLIPAYNFNLRAGDEFSPVNTPPVTGALSLLAFHRSDFIRTWHPLHSFMVWGRNAARFSDLKNKSSFGKDSPFALMEELRARMLFAGTRPADALTFTHYIEERLSVPYRRYKRIPIDYVDDHNRHELKDFLFYMKKPGWTMVMNRLENLLNGKFEEDSIINGIRFCMLDLPTAGEVIRRDINNNNAGNIAAFSTKLYLKDVVKGILFKFRKYQTAHDRISHGSNFLKKG